MNAKINYSDGPIADIEIVTDFLPSPDELALQEETVKVTIALSKESVEFFKEEASARHTPYQKMIRKLLDSYVEQQKRALTKQ
jgi:predicted DNA binding CopG/RHH family protein